LSNEIYSLAYVSRSELGKNGNEDVDTQIASILQSARRNNRLCGITGALLFSEGWFAQILEGTQEAIEEIFETIQADARHSNVTVLHFHPVSERSFPAWSMAYAGANEGARARAAAVQVLPSADEIAVQSMGQSFLSVLRDYIGRQETGLGAAAGIKTS